MKPAAGQGDRPPAAGSAAGEAGFARGEPHLHDLGKTPQAKRPIHLEIGRHPVLIFVQGPQGLIRMDDYQQLVREYEEKESQRKKYCSLNRIAPGSLARRGHLPLNVHSGKMLYLGYGRNAWHSTWIRRYYPGSISFFEKDLQLLCEKHRVQGSVFRIEPVPVVYLEYRHDVVVLLAINDRPAGAYQDLLQNIVPFRLDAFWLSDEFEVDNWLITFTLPAWRPDLYPKRYHRMSSSPQGAGRPLGWSRHEADEAQSGVSTAFLEFMPRLLKIT